MCHKTQQPHEHIRALRQRLQQAYNQLEDAWLKAGSPGQPESWARQHRPQFWHDKEEAEQKLWAWTGPEAPLPPGEAEYGYFKYADGVPQATSKLKAWLNELLDPKPVRELLDAYPYLSTHEAVASSFPDPDRQLAARLLDKLESAFWFASNPDLTPSGQRAVLEAYLDDFSRWPVEDFRLMGRALTDLGPIPEISKKLFDWAQGPGAHPKNRDGRARRFIREVPNLLTQAHLGEDFSRWGEGWSVLALLHRSEPCRETWRSVAKHLGDVYLIRKLLDHKPTLLQDQHIATQLAQQALQTSGAIGTEVSMGLLPYVSHSLGVELIEQALETGTRQQVSQFFPEPGESFSDREKMLVEVLTRKQVSRQSRALVFRLLGRQPDSTKWADASSRPSSPRRGG